MCRSQSDGGRRCSGGDGGAKKQNKPKPKETGSKKKTTVRIMWAGLTPIYFLDEDKGKESKR